MRVGVGLEHGSKQRSLVMHLHQGLSHGVDEGVDHPRHPIGRDEARTRISDASVEFVQSLTAAAPSAGAIFTVRISAAGWA